MRVVVQNLIVSYEDTGGDAPVMVFLHGWMDNLRTFDAITSPLSSFWRIIRLDLPGFGGSEIPRESWGVAEYARFVGDFCEKLHVKPYVIVGHSFGGRIIIKGVGNRVLSPKKIVFIASAGLAKQNTPRALMFLFLAKAGKIALFLLPWAMRERFRRKLYGAAGSWDYLHIRNGVLKQIFLRGIREDLSDCARRIAVPAFLIWGDRDFITPLSDGKRLNELISGSKLEIIAGAGHLVHQERPQEVASLVQKFICQ